VAPYRPACRRLLGGLLAGLAGRLVIGRAAPPRYRPRRRTRPARSSAPSRPTAGSSACGGYRRRPAPA